MNALARLLAVSALLLLAACGGAIEAGVGSGGSGAPLSVSVGPVTGFGSVIVNGERYDESRAEVLIDERPDRLTRATVAAIRLGTVVELKHRDRVISTATVAAELIGPVSSVSASSFIALGQTVRVNAPSMPGTVFDGFDTLGDLAIGAIVEVHGNRDGNGDILATRVELRAAGLALVRLAGTAANVGGETFSIGALQVNAAGASIVPARTALASGQRVVVWTDVPYTGGVLQAKVVRIGDAVIEDNASVTVDGVVARLQSAASFRVGSVVVDASGAAFTGGVAADLANGRAVRVRGTFLSGVLRASSVEFATPAQAATTLTGAITDFVDAASPFRIRDAVARATPQTTYVNGSAANLGTGVQVRLTGVLTNGVVQATTVEFLPVALDAQQVAFGAIRPPVGNPGTDGSRTFRLEGLANEVKTTASTAYANGAAADVAVGRQVRVKGSVQAGQFVATDVEFLDSVQEPPSYTIEGTAGNVRPASVVVNGNTIALTATTTYTRDGAPATSASLVNGAKVEVLVRRTGSTLTAIAVDIKADEARATTVRGIVSGRTPAGATEFMVGSQRVRVTGSPQIVPGNRTLADVVNGADVEVDGTLVSGVLDATRIKFR